MYCLAQSTKVYKSLGVAVLVSTSRAHICVLKYHCPPERSRAALDKLMISKMGQGQYQIRLEYLIVLKCKTFSKKD